MGKAWDLSLKGDSVEFIESGGKLKAGWYLAELSKEGDTDKGHKELKFTIATGPYAGKTAELTLWNPQFSDTPEKARNSANLAKSVAYRLGLITKEQIKAEGNVSLEWEKALGKRYVIDVRIRHWKSDKGEGDEPEIAKYPPGVYPLDHPAIPADVRTALQIGPARALEPGEKAGPATAPAAEAHSATPAATSAAASKSADELAANLFG